MTAYSIVGSPGERTVKLVKIKYIFVKTMLAMNMKRTGIL
jgi:hypothetical protein